MIIIINHGVDLEVRINNQEDTQVHNTLVIIKMIGSIIYIRVAAIVKIEMMKMIILEVKVKVKAKAKVLVVDIKINH